MIGTYTRKLIVARFAKTGSWCETARLIFPGGVPDGIAIEAKRERSLHLRNEDQSRDKCDCNGCLFPEVRDG